MHPGLSSYVWLVLPPSSGVGGVGRVCAWVWDEVYSLCSLYRLDSSRLICFPVFFLFSQRVRSVCGL